MNRLFQHISALAFVVLLSFGCLQAQAQCSICTRTAQQQGKEAAEGLNGGIVYLMLIPLAVGGVIGYRWWKNEQQVQADEANDHTR